MNATSCNSQPQKERTKDLKKFYEKVNQNTGEKRIKYEKMFFDMFPSSFIEMQEQFGFNQETGAAPLYDYEIKLDMNGKSMITLFSRLEHVDKERHYNKYIDICIGGKWEADNIAEGFGIYNKLYYDTEKIIPILSERKDKDVISVFRFIFDGPHPDNYRKSYESLHAKVKQVNPKVAELMKQAYEQLLSEDDGHGH